MIWGISVVILLLALPMGYFMIKMVWPCYRNAGKILKEKPIPDYYKEVKERSSYCPLEHISADLKMMVIALEDLKFFEHKGFVWGQIFRTFLRNIKHRKILGGGSTITQQLAKNMYLSPEKTYHRKLTEGFITKKLENTLSKEEILDLYLNIIYYGKGQYGIQDACELYFQNQPAQISFHQALTIASLIPGPDSYSPLVNPGLFRKAKSRTLRYLIGNEFMKQEDASMLQSAEFDEWLDNQMTRKYSAFFHECYQKLSSGGKLELDRRTITILGREIVLKKQTYTFLGRMVRVVRRLYHKGQSLRLRNRKPTIMANNCIGTFIYHDMGLPFYSPTINLSMSHKDFMKFLRDLPRYLESDVYEIEDNQVIYPVGVLRNGEETVRLNFVHYATFAEAREKWNRRKQRVNFDNLYILEFLEKANPEKIEEFLSLPYPNKLHITNANPTNAECVAVMEILNDPSYRMGQILKYKPKSLKRYMDDLDYIGFLNRKK